MSAMTRAIAWVWVLATLMLLVFPLLGTDESFRLYYSNALQTLSSLVAAGVCFYATSAFPQGSPLRKVWAAIGAGVLAWGIGATIFGAYPLLTGGEETPYPYYSDVGYLLTGPFMIVGLLIFKRATGLESPLWGKLLAAVLLVAAGIMAYRANAEGLVDPDLAMKITSLGYLVFDPLLLAVTVLTATGFRGGEVGAAWWYAVAGIILYFIANQAYTFLVLAETYATGHPIDTGWMLGFGCIAWAALKTRRLMA
ncbi:MAG: hypothetical protein NT046_01510 [Arenimonas sp.]|nr:hypothetical protein [Arenimonas sp.]